MTDVPKQPRIRARVTNEVVDYPHGLLKSAAWWMHERLKKACEGDASKEGSTLDCVALLTLTAFTLEGYANALGWHRLRAAPEQWERFEKQRTRDKIKELARCYGLSLDWNKRPFSTLSDLIDARNTFAHPKAAPAPNPERIIEGTHDELVRMLRNHKADYEKWVEWDFVNRAYLDVEAAWEALREASGVHPLELCSGGSQSIEALERIEADGTATRL